jgi:hypothetical protein
MEFRIEDAEGEEDSSLGCKWPEKTPFFTVTAVETSNLS